MESALKEIVRATVLFLLFPPNALETLESSTALVNVLLKSGELMHTKIVTKKQQVKQISFNIFKFAGDYIIEKGLYTVLENLFI